VGQEPAIRTKAKPVPGCTNKPMAGRPKRKAGWRKREEPDLKHLICENTVSGRREGRDSEETRQQPVSVRKTAVSRTDKRELLRNAGLSSGRKSPADGKGRGQREEGSAGSPGLGICEGRLPASTFRGRGGGTPAPAPPGDPSTQSRRPAWRPAC